MHSGPDMTSKEASKQSHMELRTGDVLQLSNGVTLQLQFKKGRAARFLVSAPAAVGIKKILAPAAMAAPSAAN